MQNCRVFVFQIFVLITIFVCSHCSEGGNYSDAKHLSTDGYALVWIGTAGHFYWQLWFLCAQRLKGRIRVDVVAKPPWTASLYQTWANNVRPRVLQQLLEHIAGLKSICCVRSMNNSGLTDEGLKHLSEEGLRHCPLLCTIRWEADSIFRDTIPFVLTTAYSTTSLEMRVCSTWATKGLRHCPQLDQLW